MNIVLGLLPTAKGAGSEYKEGSQEMLPCRCRQQPPWDSHLLRLPHLWGMESHPCLWTLRTHVPAKHTKRPLFRAFNVSFHCPLKWQQLQLRSDIGDIVSVLGSWRKATPAPKATSAALGSLFQVPFLSAVGTCKWSVWVVGEVPCHWKGQS